MPQLFLGILLLVSPIFAQNYDQIWLDMNPNGGDLTPDEIGLFFRSMMRPPPGVNDVTALTRSDFKYVWMPAYQDTEKIADGLFSYFDGHKDEIIDGQDLLPMMNIGDTNADGVLSRAEFNGYMDLAYAYAENQRLLPGNNANGQAHQQQHQNHHHNNHHLHQGKPFFG
ncbi:uncharacterized protein LOC124262179 [Haliotis rubra]|uniref:uncharacterized protein LOC124262179 n=1 Tax=Haliotis rubra TaxID=36100 RepID=UPI001EE5F199|nr:uncharacterized protein LOC124262179 [Haliotis rubra]